MIYVGIDENGYGPILGPLIITSCVFLVPEYPGIDMWYYLRESTSQRKKNLEQRLLVTDSKKAYSRSTGIKHIERTTLSFLDQLNLGINNFSRLLSTVSIDANQQLQKYLWYSKTNEDLLCKKDIFATTKLTKDMKEQKIELLDVRCCYFDVAKFNRRVQSTGNKAEIVTSSVLELIQSAVALASVLGEKEVFVISDRLGGRVYYEELLTKIPDFNSISRSSCLEESKYQLENKNITLDIRFEVDADDSHFPVALSSMIGKYIREKSLQYMNEYFMELQPGLKPTAGYWKDGLRFLREIDTLGPLEKIGISKNEFVRIK